MYLYDFLKSLDELSGEHVPTVPTIDTDSDVVYMCYKPVKDLDEESKKSLSNQSEMAMIYLTLPEFQLNACDVTQALRYSKKLDQEVVNDKFYSLSPLVADAIIYEAVWLLDQFTDLPSDKIFLKLCEGGVPQLNALYHDNSDADNLPVFITFDSLIARDLFVSQARYFIKKYVNARIKEIVNHDKDNEIVLDFDIVLANQLEKYFKRQAYSTWSTKVLTGIDNPEFDIFIQQLSQFTTTR